uniref:Uncharacterized protein n=1 Tax=Arundo donax TaxID=35708 RepID=A0A0A9B489_ARUDO
MAASAGEETASRGGTPTRCGRRR